MDNKIILTAKDFHDILKTTYSLGYISGQQRYPSANIIDWFRTHQVELLPDLDADWNADISEVFSVIMSTFPLEKVQ
jgi:hypothetical protein